MPKRRKVTRTRTQLTEDQIHDAVCGFCLDRGSDEVAAGPNWPWPSAEAKEAALREYAAEIRRCKEADLDLDDTVVLFRELLRAGA